MSTYNIALRYSRALFNLSATKDDLRKSLTALEQIDNIFNRFPEIMQYFSSPHISQEQKEKVFEKSLGSFFDSQLVQYFLILLKKRRFNYFPEIVKEYRRMVNEELGVIEGRLITTEPIDASTKENLQSKLEKIYGKKIELKEEVDPQLIGGGILIIGNQMIDFSIKNKLNKLKDDLLSMNI